MVGVRRGQIKDETPREERDLESVDERSSDDVDESTTHPGYSVQCDVVQLISDRYDRRNRRLVCEPFSEHVYQRFWDMVVGEQHEGGPKVSICRRYRWRLIVDQGELGSAAERRGRVYWCIVAREGKGRYGPLWFVVEAERATKKRRMKTYHRIKGMHMKWMILFPFEAWYDP